MKQINKISNFRHFGLKKYFFHVGKMSLISSDFCHYDRNSDRCQSSGHLVNYDRNSDSHNDKNPTK